MAKTGTDSEFLNLKVQVSIVLLRPGSPSMSTTSVMALHYFHTTAYKASNATVEVPSINSFPHEWNFPRSGIFRKSCFFANTCLYTLHSSHTYCGMKVLEWTFLQHIRLSSAWKKLEICGRIFCWKKLQSKQLECPKPSVPKGNLCGSLTDLYITDF